MSTNDPVQPEYLEPGSGPTDSGEPPRNRGRRTGLVAGAAVAVVAAVGVGAYGVVQLMAGGSSPATAVPADAIGYVSLDLDPSASQKIEAFKILRKFPAIKKQLGSRDDLRRAVFDEIQKSGDCKGVDYAQDIEPWIGDRVALAAVPDSKVGATPLFVLQVTDEAKAKAGARRLESCGGTATDGGDKPAGLAFVGDYLLVAETQSEADSMAKDAEASTLADSSEFTTAMDRVGDPGIVTMYVSKDAPAAFAKASGSSSDPGRITSMFKDFQGAAGVVRFAGGAVEAEFTGKGLPSGIGAAQGPDVGTLPGSTAAALAVGFKEGWVKDYVAQMNDLLGDGASVDQMLAEGERATGLQLPEDVETLLGSGLTVSIDGKTDLKALTESPDPSQVPAGIRIYGDPAKITPIIDKLKAAAGPDADLVKVSTGDGIVTVGFDQAYVDGLRDKGGLGDVSAFTDVVPDASRATGTFYVNFDAGDGWAEQLADLISDGDPEVKANIAPLDALGVSTWLDDDKVQHSLLRLTTD
ncbi:hypothetical protein BH10ACT10_BH10ACT10_09010 [soil metagenome]